MHEVGLSQQLLTMIEAQAAQNQFAKVNHINLAISRFTCVDERALRFAIEIAAKGTIAHCAKVNIDWLDNNAYCNNCEKKVTLLRYGASCPLCQGYELDILENNEFRLQSLEVE